MRLRMPRGVSLAAPLLLIAAGCAAPDFAVAPKYSATTLRPGTAPALAVSLEVKDNRPKRGEKRKSGGEVLARGNKGFIYVDTPYEAIVEEGIARALRAKGFRLAPGAPVTVVVELRRLGLEARDFTDWPVDPETSSTLDAVRIFVPRDPRPVRAETDLFVRILKPGWEAGFSHLAQKEATATDTDRTVVEETLSRALTEAVEEVVQKASADIPRAAALPVSAADFREREEAIARQEGEIEALGKRLEARRLSLETERREIDRLRRSFEKENQELAANLAEKLDRIDSREQENRRIEVEIEEERARLAAERAELHRWEKTLRADAQAAPPPAVIEKKPPVIVVTSPEGRERVTTRAEIRIEGVAFSNQGLQGVEYVVNGRPLGAERAVGGVRRERGESTHLQFARDVSLVDGRNSIVIRVVDAGGATTEEEILVVQEKERGQVHVVAVGIDSYRDAGIPPLKFAARDARTVASTLQEKLGVTRGSNVEVLLDEKATAREIKLALGGRLLARESRADTIFIYFSGHGGLAPDGSVKDGLEKYLLPVDADPSDYGATAISMDEVGRLLDHLESERLIFFADTCYSGAAGGRTVKPRGRDFRALPSESIEERLQGAGRVIMTAANASEVAQEMEDLGHGVFTYYLLRALTAGEADANEDRRLEIREVFDYVRDRVREKTGGTQNPKMSSSGGDILIDVGELKAAAAQPRKDGRK
jgi:hypothetical protein